jgi:hypothetical protein
MGVGINTFTRRAAMLWRWARGERALRLTETIAGLTPDILADTFRQVMRWTLPLEDTPEDALVYLLRDHGMPSYVEPYQQTLNRVLEFIDVIPYAGAQAMLAAQAAYCGLVNPVIVPDLPNSEFSITADNVGFMPRWGDPSLKWGDPNVWGNFVSVETGKNLRAMLEFFRPARERYTGAHPTYWTPALFAPYSWTEAKYGTAAAGVFQSFADQGTIGGTHVVTGNILEFDLLRSGSKLAVMSTDRIQHDGAPIFWRGLNGLEDGFIWWAGTLNDTDIANLANTGSSGATQIGFRLRWTNGAFVVSFSDGVVNLISKTVTGFTSGYYVVVLSIDMSLGSWGGITVSVNGVNVPGLGGNFGAPAIDADPVAAMTIGSQASGGNNFDGDFHSFGWVRGRPAILPDVQLLIDYFKAEVGNDWDPQDESALQFDFNPADTAAFSLSGTDIDSYTEPETGIVFTPPSAKPELSIGEFAGKQSGVVVATNETLANTGDGSDLGNITARVWLCVARNNSGSNGVLLLEQPLNVSFYERTATPKYGYHDGTALREAAIAPPAAGKAYTAGIWFNASGNEGRYNAGGFLQPAITYDGAIILDDTILELFGGAGAVDLTVGRLAIFQTSAIPINVDDWTKQRVLALDVQFNLPQIAS